MGWTPNVIWWARQDLNLGPMDYESTALTAELRARALSILHARLRFSAEGCAAELFRRPVAVAGQSRGKQVGNSDSAENHPSHAGALPKVLNQRTSDGPKQEQGENNRRADRPGYSRGRAQIQCYQRDYC